MIIGEVCLLTNVNLNIVFETLKNNIPELLEKLRGM